MTEVTEVSDGKTKDREITPDDWSAIAEYILAEAEKRKEDRKLREQHWSDIDRQLRMEPDDAHKRFVDAEGKVGRNDPKKQWMAAMELPLQSQTLEVLTADARRMMSPDSGPWFVGHSALTDEFLRKADFASIVAGDENDVPSQITQDAADKLAEGFCSHQMAQYDFWGNIDLINAEAFKYGVGIGRVRMATKKVFINTARGVVKEEQQIPILFPRSIKETYLDNSAHNLANEGHIVGPADVSRRKIRFVDLVMAAQKGSKEASDPNGGWMVAGLKDVDDDQVELIEYEGDLVVPRRESRSLFIPGAIVTVMVGKSDKKLISSVVRFRIRQFPFSSYLEFPYHREDQAVVYPSSPLMKGRPLQMAAVDALNRLLDAAALKNQPPIGYESDDPYFQAQGGPRLFPGAQNPTIGDIQVLDVGDPQTMLSVYLEAINQYHNVTGVNLPRLGAQTKSHTTAFAKDAELNRGVVRTVDYVRSTNKGPLTRFMDMQYEMGRKFKGTRTFYIDAYGGFVEIEQKHLPELVRWDVFGAGGPEEQATKMQARFLALQQAVALEASKVQLGQQPSMDIEAIQRQILLEGRWIDIDQFFNTGGPGVPAGAQGTSGVAGNIGGTGPAVEAVRALTGQAA